MHFIRGLLAILTIAGVSSTIANAATPLSELSTEAIRARVGEFLAAHPDTPDKVKARVGTDGQVALSAAQIDYTKGQVGEPRDVRWRYGVNRELTPDQRLALQTEMSVLLQDILGKYRTEEQDVLLAAPDLAKVMAVAAFEPAPPGSVPPPARARL